MEISGSANNYIFLQGRKYSYFGGNNYLGLAGHTAVIKSAKDSIDRYGVSFSASRQTTGTSSLHLELEALLSEFKSKKESVVYASGYLGNRILLQVLKHRYSAVFIDGSAHPSIHDAIPGDVPNIFIFDHCNTGHLETLLKKHKKFRPLIITDGVFALTGEIAPLDKIYLLAQKYNAVLITDDSHATGILGKNGRGTAEHFNLDAMPDIYQSDTLSKAIGSFGGFISADSDIVSAIKETSRIYLGSTALPPPSVAAAISAVRIMIQQPELRSVLRENIKNISDGIAGLNFATISGSTPIISLFFNSVEKASALSVYLKENNIIVPYVTYPVKMNKFIVRITASASHTNEQIAALIDSLKTWRRYNGSDKD